MIWIWDQNIAISTIVGTSSHIKVSLLLNVQLDCQTVLTQALMFEIMIEIKRKEEINVFVNFYAKPGLHDCMT